MMRACLAAGLLTAACSSRDMGETGVAPDATDDSRSPPAGSGGGAMSANTAATGGMAGTSVPGSGGAGGAAVDAATAGTDVGPARADKALLYIFSNLYFRHPSIEPAAFTLEALLKARGFSVEISKDPGKFTQANLADLRLVVMIGSCGAPLGDPETESVAALDAWIKAGGAFVGLHAASAVKYAPTSRFVAIMGGRFAGHPGDLRAAMCTPQGTHPSVVNLRTPFMVHDEIYVFDGYNDTNQVDLRCAGLNGALLPIAWHRSEGAGRVFYSALGHEISVWQPDSPMVTAHVWPGILWALGQ